MPSSNSQNADDIKIGHYIKIGLYIQIVFTNTFATSFLSFGFFGIICQFRWDAVYVIVLIGVWIIFIIMMFKSWWDDKDKRNETPMLEKCRKDYAIGSAGIFLFTIVPVVLFRFCGFPVMVNIYIFFLCNITSTVLYYVFIWRIEHLCRLEHNTSDLIIYSLAYCIIGIERLVPKTFEEKENECVIKMAVCAYFTSLICSTITLVSLASGQLKLVEESDDEESEGVVHEKSSGEAQKQSIDVECKICMEKYDAFTENRIPRILTKCGHTLCHGCIKRVLIPCQGFLRYHFIIFCPFCQQVTSVNEGNVRNLPKNFAILKWIR